ncbi:helix-turn-helix transcriptional regulator [Chryseobacterium suipulveris]|uniref:helix-turn-helix transcriptional regulator n=1 Tax=Chryseobacterium suipulveris TaxID=2929800 RepID=UPI0037BE4442
MQLDPKLSISELQFCALLKLNFASKEIANNTFTSIRTVQNKKYRIRSKLNIPNETDTYVLFNDI